MVNYLTTLHKQEAFPQWNNLSFPITEKIHNEVLSLPISSVLTDNEVSYIVDILNQY
ncbi:DegT/DnrJ/EryC1/StrS family aminotransferase [Flavobacterium sp. EDS]|uniref:DegT/DnrJ/EryC1/StrS family aminotransferase n=1 Tax=Flavobacterium sp. EDS TaxID=2897328 RepID=UPI001E32A0A5|nr:DegT/DnrJ/EryC1/StrS family aminotransferase [Flavobacterium sp. EDS]